MVKRIISLIHREYTNVHQAAFLLGIFAFISQILGLFRDRMLAHSIGLSSSLDIYYAAFRIPDFIYVSIASLASITVLIPFLIERNEKSHSEARKFMSDVFTVFLCAMVLASILLFIFMPTLTALTAPGFHGEEFTRLVMLSRLLLLSPILLGLSNLFGAATQFYKKFFLFALSPILYNVGILVGVVFLYPRWGIMGLGAGVIIGALAHAAMNIPVITRHGLLPKFSTQIDWKSIRDLIVISLPRTLGLAMNNIALIIITGIASIIGVGAISVFRLSYNLESVPLAIVGMSFSVAAFPTLAHFFSNGKKEEFVTHFKIAAKQIIFWSLPVTVLFIVLRAQIVRVILGSGKFTWSDTKLTAAALALFAISALAQGMVMLFARGFFAAGKTKKPVILNLISSALIVVLAYGLLIWFNHSLAFRTFFEHVLRVDGMTGTAVLILPLAYSIGTTLNFVLHWIHFKHDFVGPKPFIRKTFVQSLIGSLAIGLSAYEALNIFSSVFDLNTFSGIFLQGLVAGVIGIIFGFVVLTLLGSEELRDIRRTLRTKFWRTSFIGAEQTDL